MEIEIIQGHLLKKTTLLDFESSWTPTFWKTILGN